MIGLTPDGPCKEFEYAKFEYQGLIASLKWFLPDRFIGIGSIAKSKHFNRAEVHL